MLGIKELIVVIQILAGVVAGFRILYLFLNHIHDEDFTARNNKMKNVILALFLIEFGLGIGTLIQSYYN